MTKRIDGVNPDFADFDEYDDDAADAITEYELGGISFEELKTMIGYDAARAVQDKVHGEEEFDLDQFFDDPEELY